MICEPGHEPARAVAHVDVGAIARNCERLRASLAGEAALCAVVKANGYGHGALHAARGALTGGATWLAVASAGEALALREGGITARLLVLGAVATAELPALLDADADVVAWSDAFVTALARSAARRGCVGRVHLKLDVGMGRNGTRDARALLALAECVAGAPALELVGATTHFPCADEDPERTRAQLAAFTRFGAALQAAYPEVLLHAANSAATLLLPESHLGMVRCGIAIYGLDPFGRDPRAHGLEPALALRSYVATLKPLAAGETVGYGATFVARTPTWVATLPIGYGDGYRRAFSDNAEVVIRGRRCPVIGRVSMDNITVDVGPDPDVRAGDIATLLGEDGPERIGAEELALRIGTINYEVTTALTERVVRRPSTSPEPGHLLQQ